MTPQPMGMRPGPSLCNSNRCPDHQEDLRTCLRHRVIKLFHLKFSFSHLLVLPFSAGICGSHQYSTWLVEFRKSGSSAWRQCSFESCKVQREFVATCAEFDRCSSRSRSFDTWQCSVHCLKCNSACIQQGPLFHAARFGWSEHWLVKVLPRQTTLRGLWHPCGTSRVQGDRYLL